MTETEDSRDRPGVRLMAPYDDEIGHPLAPAGVELTEAMDAPFDGAEVFHGENAQASRNKLPPEPAADVLFRVRDHLLTRPGHSTRVVIELHVGREVAGVLPELFGRAAVVEGVEHGRIERRDRFDHGVRRRTRPGARGRKSPAGSAEARQHHNGYQRSLAHMRLRTRRMGLIIDSASENTDRAFG